MPIANPKTGLVVSYNYVWRHQHERGETAGRKARPACLVVLLARTAEHPARVVLYPITSQPPGPDRAAIELPAIEKRRLGLTDAPRSWIILDETNGDELPTSPHFERVAGAPDHPFVYGELSRAFLKQFAQAALAVTRRIAVPRIPRG